MSEKNYMKFRLEITLENITFVSSVDIFGSIVNINLDKKDLMNIYNIFSKFSKYFERLSAFLQNFEDNLATFEQNLRIHNMLPLEIKLVEHDITITPIIPASTLRGLLRYAYDIRAIVEKVYCEDIENKSNIILKEILLTNREKLNHLISNIKNILISPLKVKQNVSSIIVELFTENSYSKFIHDEEEKLCLILLAYILSLQSRDSCLSIFDEISCSLPLPRSLLNTRKLLKELFGKQYDYTLCKSCLVFGCRGFKSPVAFKHAKPKDTSTRFVMRTFNQICQPNGRGIAKTAPYTLIGFDKNISFEAEIVLMQKSFYELANKISLKEHSLKYEDLVVEVLEESIESLLKEKLGCIITLGRRGTVGFGKIFINISNY